MGLTSTGVAIMPESDNKLMMSDVVVNGKKGVMCSIMVEVYKHGA